MAKNNELAWHEVASVQCVEAPCCGFTFAACHTDEDGSFSCPICDDVPAAEARGRAEERARIVAWLKCFTAEGSALDALANDIERGAHAEANMSDDIYRRAVERYGHEAQMRMLQEECAELIVAASHYLRDRDDVTEDDIASELADVEIMLEQMRAVFGDNLVDEAKRAKLERLAKRLEVSDE